MITLCQTDCICVEIANDNINQTIFGWPAAKATSCLWENDNINRMSALAIVNNTTNEIFIEI